MNLVLCRVRVCFYSFVAINKISLYLMPEVHTNFSPKNISLSALILIALSPSAPATIKSFSVILIEHAIDAHNSTAMRGMYKFRVANINADVRIGLPSGVKEN